MKMLLAIVAFSFILTGCIAEKDLGEGTDALEGTPMDNYNPSSDNPGKVTTIRTVMAMYDMIKSS